MFSTTTLNAEMEEHSSTAHDVRVVTPLSFVIRPLGFPADLPAYRIVVERAAFEMHARLALDPLAQALRSAISQGVSNNPGRLQALAKSVAGFGWRPDFDVTESDLRINAHSGVEQLGRLDDLKVQTAIRVALQLSEFVLDQVVITRRLETRAASRREVESFDEDPEVWEYDPSERDRATMQHRLLENWLMDSLRSVGIEALDVIHGPAFDVGWRVGSTFFVCEVKSTSGSEDKQLRLGMGQVLHYQWQLRRHYGGTVVAALLVGQIPSDESWVNLASEHGITLFWPSEELPSQLTIDRTSGLGYAGTQDRVSE